jgi:hypothetical protein
MNAGFFSERVRREHMLSNNMKNKEATSWQLKVQKTQGR